LEDCVDHLTCSFAIWDMEGGEQDWTALLPLLRAAICSFVEAGSLLLMVLGRC
jgi:hypothetical protein